MSIKNIRAAVLTSTNLRHRYFHRVIEENFNCRLVFAQSKANYYQEQREESELIRQHFSDLAVSESEEFTPYLSPSLISPKIVLDINSPTLVAETLDAGVEILFLFGTEILGEEWLNAFPNRIINLHLGLSPYYRGSATLFWPFVTDELECIGVTIHLAVARVDAGPILARVKPKLQLGDTYYTITNRLIRESIDALPSTALRYLSGNIVPLVQVSNGERVWRKTDFSEVALRRALSIAGLGLTVEQIACIESSEKCHCSQ